MEIAVVGAGIAGLSAAWRLSARHRVTLIEKLPVAGMDAHSIDLPHDGTSFRIDVPLRVLYEGYYPTLIALYGALGVETERTNYAGSFSRLGGDVYYRYANWVVGDRSIPLPARPLGRAALRLNAARVRVYRQAPAPRYARGGSGHTHGAWLGRTGVTTPRAMAYRDAVVAVGYIGG